MGTSPNFKDFAPESAMDEFISFSISYHNCVFLIDSCDRLCMCHKSVLLNLTFLIVSTLDGPDICFQGASRQVYWRGSDASGHFGGFGCSKDFQPDEFISILEPTGATFLDMLFNFANNHIHNKAILIFHANVAKIMIDVKSYLKGYNFKVFKEWMASIGCKWQVPGSNPRQWVILSLQLVLIINFMKWVLFNSYLIRFVQIFLTLCFYIKLLVRNFPLGPPSSFAPQPIQQFEDFGIDIVADDVFHNLMTKDLQLMREDIP
jgi:hypothetical protein